jgi:hypothetical protein
LAGREHETNIFRDLLRQTTVMQNLVLTGLRGVGKTVLLETFKPIAQQQGWLWVGTDMSEAASLTDERMATRLLTDLSVRTAALTLSREVPTATFLGKASEHQRLDYGCLADLYQRTPGLHADKLKAVLEFAWACFRQQQPPIRGLIFAYDEAQTLSDNAADREYPLSMMLDVFQSIQKKGIPFMLVLTGLPTLFPKLVEARTFAERMFRVVFLDHLARDETRDAIRRPIADAGCPLRLSDPAIGSVHDLSGGYPYFIQFICRELYDIALQNLGRASQMDLDGTFREIIRKLDCDFFSGRWARVTDRQRDILVAIAHLPNCHTEFSVQEVVEVSGKRLAKGFSASRVSQLMLALSEAGLVYKNRHGRYAFAVPMLGPFILRQVG